MTNLARTALTVATAASCALAIAPAVSAASPTSTAVGGSLSAATVLARAHSWISEDVPYDQDADWTDFNGTYRQDCSGLISMAWHLTSSLSTQTLPDVATRLSSLTDLQPGDIIDAEQQHVVLFVSWTNSSRSTANVIEEAHPGTDARTAQYSAAYLKANGYHPYRYHDITAPIPAAIAPTDTTPPLFTTAPVVRLRTGTVNAAAVPVTATWKASDTNGIATQTATSPTVLALPPTTDSWSTTAASGRATTFAIRATDPAGNSSYASVRTTASVIEQTSATRSGSWSTRSDSEYLGGTSYSSSHAGASLTYNFTARSIALIVSRAPTSGQVRLYLDGIDLATVDLKSATTRYRQAVWTHTWNGSTHHTLKVVVVGTQDRPTITTDGIATLS